MRTSWIDATLSALLGFVAALLAVVARLPGRTRSTHDRPISRSFDGWSAAGLSEGPSSRRWLLGNDRVDDATRARLATAWQDAARAAHNALAASTQRALDLVTLCAPPELVAAAHEDALDEIRRAKVCFALARGLDGRSAVPGRHKPPRRALPGLRCAALARLASEVVVDGALVNGVSARINAKLARRTTDGAIRAALEEISAAQARHVVFLWSIVAWCLAEGGAPVEHALRALVGRLPTSARELPQEAREGGWERWGIAGAALERQERARAVESIERRITELAEKGAPADERLAAA